jgi:hypothetical protein
MRSIPEGFGSRNAGASWRADDLVFLKEGPTKTGSLVPASAHRPCGSFSTEWKSISRWRDTGSTRDSSFRNRSFEIRESSGA